MHPVQEHINTPGIDYSVQRLTEYKYEYERYSFPTQSVTIKLRQHKTTPAQQILMYISFTAVYPREPVVKWFGRLSCTQKVVG